MKLFRTMNEEEGCFYCKQKLDDTCLYRTHDYSTEEVQSTHLSIGWSYLYSYGL
jgi:hypothetical protein